MVQGVKVDNSALTVKGEVGLLRHVGHLDTLCVGTAKVA